MTIGNEMLIGHTLDTNSNWIAKHATGQGWTVQRITQVRDSLDTIRDSVREALKRTPKLLLTIGGLGPTHDDMTLRGVAKALGKPLVLNPTAMNMLRARYRNIQGKKNLTKHRRKMALLPQGATPLNNPMGTAPGVMIKASGSVVVSLPGVPEEMKAIFKESVIPFLKTANAEPPKEAYLFVTGIIESSLAPILSAAQRKYPGLYFKSHPRGRETGARTLIQIHLYNTNAKSRGKIQNAALYLVRSLSRIGVH